LIAVCVNANFYFSGKTSVYQYFIDRKTHIYNILYADFDRTELLNHMDCLEKDNISFCTIHLKPIKKEIYNI